VAGGFVVEECGSINADNHPDGDGQGSIFPPRRTLEFERNDGNEDGMI
jgi:hypothetical protein